MTRQIFATALFAAISFAAFATEPVPAGGTPPPQDRPSMSDRMRSEAIEKMKANELSIYKRRIDILQDAMKCIQSANTSEDHRVCKEHERVAQNALLTEQRDRMDRVRRDHDRGPGVEHGPVTVPRPQ